MGEAMLRAANTAGREIHVALTYALGWTGRCEGLTERGAWLVSIELHISHSITQHYLLVLHEDLEVLTLNPSR